LKKLVKGFAPAGQIFAKKWNFFTILGPHSHSWALIGVKFCTAKRTYVPNFV